MTSNRISLPLLVTLCLWVAGSAERARTAASAASAALALEVWVGVGESQRVEASGARSVPRRAGGTSRGLPRWLPVESPAFLLPPIRAPASDGC